MKSPLSLASAILGTMLLVLPSVHAQEKSVVAAAVETIVTVVDVDREARVVTVKGPKGDLSTINVPPEAQNLDQVHPGAQFKVLYIESVAVSITKGGAASSSSSRAVKLAPKGDVPGGTIVNVRQVAGIVEAIDYGSRQISIRGPEGNLLVVTAGDEVQGLEQLQTGDRISVAYTESLALRMIPK